MDTKIKLVMWYVYRGINHTHKEIYHGVSPDVVDRIDNEHCKGKTKAIEHWDCEEDDIKWNKNVSAHITQEEASKQSHKLEDEYKYDEYENIQTGGI